MSSGTQQGTPGYALCGGCHSLGLMDDKLLPTAAGMVATILHIASETPSGACARSGCRPGLMAGILSGRTDPDINTVERVANALDLEIRIRFQPLSGMFSEPGGVDVAAVKKYQSVLSEERPPTDRVYDYDCVKRLAVRDGIDVALVRPPWDGSDPAPARVLSAGHCRHDRGGLGAILLRCVLGPTGLSAQELSVESGFGPDWARGILTGRRGSPFGEIVRALGRERGGKAFDPFIGPFDASDDLMQLDYLNDTEAYDRIQYARNAGLSPIAGMTPDRRPIDCT